MPQPGPAACLAGAALAAVLLFAGTRKAGGTAIPAFTEDVNNVVAGHLATVAELHQVAYMPHRYPSRTGGEVNALIHGGWAQARIPVTPGSVWLTRPPSEMEVLT